MSIHESAEMYLETIYRLSKHSGGVRSVAVAEELGYSRPSVSRAVGLLKQAGHLTVEKGGELILTQSGLDIAQKIYERHTVLTLALEALGVDPDTAAEDACKMEHVISDRAFAAIRSHVNNYERNSQKEIVL